MKRVDVTKSVMEKVARYEETRSSGWLWRFRIFLGVVATLFIVAVWHIGNQVRESGSLDLLAIFQEDAEIIREFWHENIVVFFEELPQDAVVFAVLLVLLSVSFIAYTRKTRKIMARRLAELAKKRA